MTTLPGTAPTTTGRVLHWAARYDLLVWLLTHGRSRAFREKLVGLASLAPGASVLDVGCGTGSLAIAAKRHVGATGEVCGIDASPEMIARATSKAARAGLDVRFENAVAESLPFPDAQFDVVLSTLMLHHLPRKVRQQCAREIRRVLKPGGHLLVVDGNAGLKHALKQWDGVRVQRCTTHKLENLRTHCPRHAQAEMKRDYHRLLYAADGLAARAAYDAFVKKWSALCPAVAKSLEEAGLELLTFYDFPKAMWKSLRTTNTVENLNREFRRRTKTQASFGTEAAALTVLYGLVAFGHIQLRKIDGHHQLPAFLAKAWQKVA